MINDNNETRSLGNPSKTKLKSVENSTLEGGGADPSVEFSTLFLTGSVAHFANIIEDKEPSEQ